MKITNKNGLPTPIVEAISARTYHRGSADFTATELCTPSRILILRRRHDDDLEEDASGRIWSLHGTAIHNILEVAAEHGDLPADSPIEERLEITLPSGLTVSGKPDYIEGDVLMDWKNTKAWNILEGPPDTWTPQLNTYAALARESLHRPINRILAWVMVRDWSRAEALRDAQREGGGRYPKAECVPMEIPVWDHDSTIDWMDRRAKAHRAALDLEDARLPVCSPSERWSRPDEWRVKKSDGKRAIAGGVCQSAEAADRVKRDAEATEAAKTKGKKATFIIEHTAGAPVRCQGNYCGVSSVCGWWAMQQRGDA